MTKQKTITYEYTKIEADLLLNSLIASLNSAEDAKADMKDDGDSQSDIERMHSICFGLAKMVMHISGEYHDKNMCSAKKSECQWSDMQQVLLERYGNDFRNEKFLGGISLSSEDKS